MEHEFPKRIRDGTKRFQTITSISRSFYKDDLTKSIGIKHGESEATAAAELEYPDDAESHQLDHRPDTADGPETNAPDETADDFDNVELPLLPVDVGPDGESEAAAAAQLVALMSIG
uniref:Uncharacterized protein n=1 Tax=Tetranychus urticae TaxID=32264 RepID=T1KQF7_TETUR